MCILASGGGAIQFSGFPLGLLLVVIIVLGRLLSAPSSVFETLNMAWETKNLNQPAWATSVVPIPINPKAVLVTSSEENVRSFMLYHGTWESEDSVPVLSLWYEQGLREAGWQLSVHPANRRAQQVQFMAFRKADLVANFSLTAKPGGGSWITIDIVPLYDNLEEEEAEDLP